jgi:N6-L-threonylcarbamoyladenine synthase
LVGSLLVGLSAAKGIAAVLRCPLVGYDHIAAHLYACRLAHGERMTYPCVGLVASGGHTSLFHLQSPLELERLGGTIDDAAGEAFDKAAALLGLGYPGGPSMERAAVGGNPAAHRFPRPLAADRDRMDVSFSGLKTALRYRVRPPGAPDDTPAPTGRALADLAASFQQAVVETILAKVGDGQRSRVGGFGLQLLALGCVVASVGFSAFGAMLFECRSVGLDAVDVGALMIGVLLTLALLILGDPCAALDASVAGLARVKL